MIVSYVKSLEGREMHKFRNDHLSHEFLWHPNYLYVKVKCHLLKRFRFWPKNIFFADILLKNVRSVPWRSVYQWPSGLGKVFMYFLHRKMRTCSISFGFHAESCKNTFFFSLSISSYEGALSLLNFPIKVLQGRAGS